MSGPIQRLSLPIMLFRSRAAAPALILVALFFLMSVAPAQAATITVTTASNGIVDSGECSLPEALANAENDALTHDDCLVAGQGGAVVDTIAFNITNPAQCPGGICTIRPATTLTITKPVMIDGYTQPGASPNTLAVGNNAVLKIVLSGELTPPNSNGLTITANAVTIRGLVINRYDAGSAIALSSGQHSRIVGNFLGTDASGTTAQRNLYGVRTVNPGAFFTIVGGTSPDARNLISGNQFGVSLEGGSAGSRIEGNYIGTSVSGTQALGNVTSGVSLGASMDTVGGTAPGAGNLISGNYYGVFVFGAGPSGNRVQGNLIGTDVTSTAPLGNRASGVYIQSSPKTIVGGAEPGAGNTIAFNGSEVPHGVLAVDGAGHAILGNRIFSNIGLAINLYGVADLASGVTPNDVGDSDTGANNLQNFPVLTSATVGAATVVGGTLNSTPDRVYRIELFGSQTCDASGHGEGQTFLGFVTPSTDGNGNASFVASLPVVPAGQAITATATNLATNDTSEFSACRIVQKEETVCAPRPRVGVTTAVASSGLLRAMIASQTSPATPTNWLVSLRITRIDNATVTLNGSPVTAGSTVTLPAGTSQATLLIQRQSAGRGSTVAFEAVDVCGAWPTFVGGGPNAF